MSVPYFSCVHARAEGEAALVASDRTSGQVVGVLCKRCVLRRERLLLWCTLLVRERGKPGEAHALELRAGSPVVAQLRRRIESSMAMVMRQKVPRRLNREIGLELVRWERELAEPPAAR